ncbi:MAG: two-component system sensor histidine kinase YxjM [Congregibacter sp.]
MTPASMTVEQHLLNASGFAAIALITVVSGIAYGLWPSLAVNLAFAGAFAVSTYGRQFGLAQAVQSYSVVGTFLISLCLLWLIQDTVALVLSIVVMASAPYHLTTKQSWLLMAVANICYWLVMRAHSEEADYLFSWLSLAALQAFALTSSLARQREIETKEILAQKNSELLAARAIIAHQSQTEERLRIAGDLHDAIGHQLTALRLNLEALSHEAPDTLQDSVSRCQLLASDLLEDIRSIVRRMADEPGSGLEAAIRELGALTPQLTIHVESDLPRFSSALAQQMVFCIQEAISNALRHGQATHVNVSHDAGHLLICDNGKGLRGKSVQAGFGLSNINKRLKTHGASATLEGSAKSGACLRIRLPEATAL